MVVRASFIRPAVRGVVGLTVRCMPLSVNVGKFASKKKQVGINRPIVAPKTIGKGPASGANAG